MARWECIVCGWIYDEEKGWPDDGIAPGTPWDQVPDDFLCPECGAQKQDFVPLDSSAATEAAQQKGPVAQPRPRPLVVIGNRGIGCRRLPPHCPDLWLGGGD